MRPLQQSLIPSAAVITIDGSGSAFAAYRLFNLTTSLKTGDTHEDGKHTSDCYNYSYTLNEKYRLPLLETLLLMTEGHSLDCLDSMTEEQKTAWNEMLTELQAMSGKLMTNQLISGLSKMSPEDLRLFSDSLYAYIQKSGNIMPDLTTAEKAYPDPPQGYYLIVETAAAGHDDAVSSVILDTNGLAAVTVYLKEEAPVLQKIGIKDRKPFSGTSAEPGETIRFLLNAQMIDEVTYNIVSGFDNLFGADDIVPIIGAPEVDVDHVYPNGSHASNGSTSLVTRYPEYYLKFIDTPQNMTYVPNSARIFFVSPFMIPYIYQFMEEQGVLDYEKVLPPVTEVGLIEESEPNKDIIALELTEFSAMNWDVDTKKLTVEMENLYGAVGMAATDSRFVQSNALEEILDFPESKMLVAPTSYVFVTYEVTLDETFEAGASGNKNSAVLEYSNDPYHEGSHGTTSENPNAQSEVYSWVLKVNKMENLGTEAEPNLQPLVGARFKVQKMKYPADFPTQFTETAEESAETALMNYQNDLIMNHFEELWVDYLTNPELNEGGTEFTFKGLKDNEIQTQEDIDALFKYIYDETSGDLTAIDTSKLAGFEPGIYRLVETVVPQGYNKADDLFFEINGEYTVNPETGAHEFVLKVYDIPYNEMLDGATVDVLITDDGDPSDDGDDDGSGVDVNKPVSEKIIVSATDAGQLETTVLNVSGTLLPSTGGTGTTMLYVGGGLLMLLAIGFVVLKIRKKPDVE